MRNADSRQTEQPRGEARPPAVDGGGENVNEGGLRAGDAGEQHGVSLGDRRLAGERGRAGGKKGGGEGGGGGGRAWRRSGRPWPRGGAGARGGEEGRRESRRRARTAARRRHR